ncbi:LYR motif-containing protein 7 [Cavenderia fasciculata]|uniref:LYR motif-containing protein 7 n=1 Tax=Cavenderia fasciculata TaxID=261658 RepID=F4Q9B8_CACFS|nr:LYR motif-containing protein 7 [Cavenderia fasciculata]EGG15287.1 LYR motif-containing protein 7 [Cavenderia fasciculata]|eukprot:XP_004352007.1 LYR motif-containing protein 7 [Cavenderia fasciculata]
MSNISKQVIKSYIRLLRTEKRVFGQDMPTLDRVTEQTRTQFRANSNESDPIKIDEMVQHANAVSDFLLTNTVQAVKKTDTQFGMKLEQQQDKTIVTLKFRPENELHVEKTYEFVGDQGRKRVVNRNRNKDAAAGAAASDPMAGSMEKFKPIRRKFEFQGRTVYEWDQTLEDVNIYITPPPGVTAKMIDCTITKTRLSVGLKGNPPFLDEEFYSTIKEKESLWMIEDGELHITLQKMTKAETWSMALKGHKLLSDTQKETQISEDVKKQMMLERFQQEHPEFDFSSAQFNGEAPDAKTFLGGMKE